MTNKWVTEIHLRQEGYSHEVAHAEALEAAGVLMSMGYDVTLKPTLPDIPVGATGEGKSDGE